MPVLRSKPKQKTEYAAFFASHRRSKPAPETDRRFSDSSATSGNSNNLRPVDDDMACGSNNLENLAAIIAAHESDVSMDPEVCNTITKKAKKATTKKVTNTKAITAEGIEPSSDDDDTIIEDTDSDTTPPRDISIEVDKPERGTDLTSLAQRPFTLSVDPDQAFPTPPLSNSSRTPSPPPKHRPTRTQRNAQKRTEAKHRNELAKLHAEVAKKHRQLGIFSWVAWPQDKGKNGKAKGSYVGVAPLVKQHRFVDTRERGCITGTERDEDREMLRQAGIVIEGL